MKAKALALTAMATVLGVAPATGRTGHGASPFMGHWRIVGVAVSDAGVQALSDNDPTLMEKLLLVSHPSRLEPDASHQGCLREPALLSA